jgi:hypothetical protein
MEQDNTLLYKLVKITVTVQVPYLTDLRGIAILNSTGKILIVLMGGNT